MDRAIRRLETWIYQQPVTFAYEKDKMMVCDEIANLWVERRITVVIGAMIGAITC